MTMTRRRTRTFYRLARSDPPTVDDFTSNCELGRRRRPERGETIEDWTGLSVYDSLDGIRDLLRRAQFSARARWVARLEVPEGAAIEWKKTHGPGHWTIWGSLRAILATVVSVAHVAD
ncbi:MAG: hypothetical protein ACRDI2_26380 [Chloroflexota bacterium]